MPCVRRAGNRTCRHDAELTVMNDLEQLARLRVAAISGHIPRDLADWAIQRIAAGIDRRAARHEWVPLLRRASALIAGSTRRKARVLAALVVNLRHYANIEDVAGFSPGDAPYLVREALRVEPNLPTSARQIRRLIE